MFKDPASISLADVKAFRSVTRKRLKKQYHGKDLSSLGQHHHGSKNDEQKINNYVEQL